MRGIIEQVMEVKQGGAVKLMTFYGASSESKPTENIADGSVSIETDTTDMYIFDETNQTWRTL